MQVISADDKQGSFPNPYTRFMYAIQSPETKRRYPQRFKAFLDYIGIPGTTIEDRLITFYERAKVNPDWLQNCLMDFIDFQKERVEKKEIAASTISNYYKPVKLFRDMNNIIIN